MFGDGAQREDELAGSFSGLAVGPSKNSRLLVVIDGWVESCRLQLVTVLGEGSLLVIFPS